MYTKKLPIVGLLFLISLGCEKSELPQEPQTARALSDQALKVAFLGDSLTEGFGIEKESAYPALVQNILSKKGKMIESVNAGISGSTSASAVSRMKWLIKARPDWVVLALGANDGLRGLSIDEMKKNLDEAISVAGSAGIRVVLVGMKTPPNYGKDYSDRFEKAFSELAKKHSNAVFIPFLLKDVGGEPNLNLPDGMHPNEKGHQVIAEHVASVLNKVL